MAKLHQLGQDTKHRVRVIKTDHHRTTQQASLASFARLSSGLVVADAKSYYPFSNPADKRKYHGYSESSQACIATALRFGIVGAQSTGTAPELVVLGYYLAQPSWILGQNLLFQTQGFDVFHRYKPFTVDIAVRYAGLIYYYPVDGARFHEATLFQIVRDMERDARLEVQGEVVPIPDSQCQNVPRLQMWLKMYGAPS